MLWRLSKLIEPCLPSPTKASPSGPGWLHEIKHDGFRILARRDSAGVRLIILLLIFLLVASSAKAQTSNRTGNWLYTVCAASDQGGRLVCQMWLSGFQAGIISSQNLAQVNKLKPASCIPQDVTADQAKLIIEKFLKDNPQHIATISGNGCNLCLGNSLSVSVMPMAPALGAGQKSKSARCAA